MGTRLELHAELLKFLPNAYFQPPSNLQMKYPCIVYAKSMDDKLHGNNGIYLRTKGYRLTLIETNPDSVVAETIEEHFDYATIGQHFVVDSLHHTTINLYY